jgi:hypothetical protein
LGKNPPSAGNKKPLPLLIEAYKNSGWTRISSFGLIPEVVTRDALAYDHIRGRRDSLSLGAVLLLNVGDDLSDAFGIHCFFSEMMVDENCKIAALIPAAAS